MATPVYRRHAVNTKPRWEKKIAESLTRPQIKNYCPLNKVWRQWSDRKKLVHEPLFKSYVFVRILPTDQWKVREIYGILNFLNWLGKPAVIRYEEIALIKKFLNDHENVQAQKCTVKVNDTVRFTRNTAIKVFLPSLGYQMIAELKKTNIEVVNKTAPISAHPDTSCFRFQRNLWWVETRNRLLICSGGTVGVHKASRVNED